MNREPLLPSAMVPESIAYCGINCATCMNFQRERNKKNWCDGCRSGGIMVNHCTQCKIRNCAIEKGVTTCAECKELPCKLIKNIDKRYRKSYNLSLLDNLLRIGEIGYDKFLSEEQMKWKCSSCGGIRCVHREDCRWCGNSE